jgi:dTDP-4-amino-4,6-dideoxygalactose transaminase
MKSFEPSISNSGIARVGEILKTGDIGFGNNVEVFEDKFSRFSNKEYNIGLSSASAAAYCLFAYLYEKHGSCDVYTPSIGFTSPAWAAAKNGHKVYFIDVDENLLTNFELYRDVRKWHLERQFNVDFNKSVFMPLLYGGVSNIDGLIKQVRDTNWGDIIVVDSAHCLQPTIDSDYTFFSFHPIKPLTMANGGTLATDDKEANEYIRRFRNFGRESKGDSYNIIHDGFNFYMNNLNATIGLSQLDSCLENIKIRKSNFQYLKESVKPELGYFTEHDDNSSYYLATLILNEANSPETRARLREKGCACSFHYPPLHRTEFFESRHEQDLNKSSKKYHAQRRSREEYLSWTKGKGQHIADMIYFGTFNVELRNTDNYENRIINLPIHQNLTKDDLDKVIEAINNQGE